MIHHFDFNHSIPQYTNLSSLYTFSFVAAIPFFSIGIIANTILLYLISSDSYFHKMTYRLIRISVISDLISLITSTCVFTFMATADTGYYARSCLCKLLIVVAYTCYGISMTTLCMISIDRYMGIVKAISSLNHYRRNRQIIYIGQIVGSIISLCIALPAAFYSDVRATETQLCDIPNVTVNVAIYMFFSIILLYFTPTIIMVVNYARIIRYQFNYVQPGYRDCNEHCSNQLKKKKFVRVLIIITSIYLFITWPFFGVLAGMAISGKSLLQLRIQGVGYYVLAFSSFVSTFAINVINPLVYLLFDYNIKKRLVARCRRFTI